MVFVLHYSIEFGHYSKVVPLLSLTSLLCPLPDVFSHIATLQWWLSPNFNEEEQKPAHSSPPQPQSSSSSFSGTFDMSNPITFLVRVFEFVSEHSAPLRRRGSFSRWREKRLRRRRERTSRPRRRGENPTRGWRKRRNPKPKTPTKTKAPPEVNPRKRFPPFFFNVH